MCGELCQSGGGILAERVGQEFDLDSRRYTLVEDIVDCVKNRHIYMKMLIDALHTGRTVVALCYHLHLYLCILDAVASADHRAKYAVAREIGVAGHE